MESTFDNHKTDKPAKILLVDDEASNRFLMRDILENSGYEIVEAENGRVALDSIESEPPDTVLLDVMMPEMDGFETCRHLKAQQATRSIPVLMVSALSDRKNRLKGIFAGAIDFITKPIDTQDMLLRVGNAVSSKRGLDEVSEHCQRLQRFEEERDKLMIKVVHDMRSPLQGISGNLQLLEMLAADKLNDDEKNYITLALESAEKLNRQVESLLSPEGKSGAN